MTDANLYLGYLADGADLGGRLRLDRAAAQRALAALGERLALDALAVARGIVRLANTQMIRALRVISVERGLDPRTFALMAFGGAGPMHACALARELGMRTVLIPRAGGVLSALGLAVSDLRRDFAHPLLERLDEIGRDALEQPFVGMEAQAQRALANPRCERRADLRYRGQSFELTVDAGDADALAACFHAAHEQRYGYRMDGQPVDVVTLRLVARQAVDKPALQEAANGEGGQPGRRCINIEGAWHDAPVWPRQAMRAGSTIDGPAVVAFRECTALVERGWAGEIDRYGTLVLNNRSRA